MHRHRQVRNDVVARVSANAEPLSTPLEVDAEHIALSHAVLCADCSHIYRMTRDACPACASRSALALAVVLDHARNREFVEALRGLAKLLAFAKRPYPKKEKARAVTTVSAP